MSKRAKKNARKNLQTSQAAFRIMAEQAGFPLIGFDISWELVIGSEAAISRKKLIELYNRYGLDHYYLPPQIQPVEAFRKAVRNINSRMDKKEGRNQTIHEIIKLDDRATCLIYAVVDREINRTAEDVQHDYSTKIKFDKQNGQVTFHKGRVTSKFGAPHPAAKLVKALYEEYSDQYIGWDLMRTLTRNMIHQDYLDGIRLMRQAGRYFVPATVENEAVLTAHKLVIQDLAEGCNFYMEDKFSTPDHVERVASGAMDTFKQQLKDYLEEIDAFKAKAPRESTLDNKLEAYKALKRKVQTYVDRLGIRLEAITEGLKDCEAIVSTFKAEGHYRKTKKQEKEAAKRTRKVVEPKPEPVETKQPEPKVTTTTTKGGTTVTVKEVIPAEMTIPKTTKRKARKSKKAS